MSTVAWRIVVAVLGLALMLSALGVVYAKHEARTRFVELQRLTNERDNLHIEWGHLQLAQSTWASNGRVEGVARGTLHMVTPQAADLRIVQP